MSKIEDARNELMAVMRTVTGVWSLTGREVTFTARHDSGLEVGGFVIVTTPHGVRLLVQVDDLVLSEREGMKVEVDTDEFGPSVAATTRSAQVALLLRFVTGSGSVLAEVTDDGLGPIPAGGFAEGHVAVAPAEVVRELVDRSVGNSAGLPVGEVESAGVPALLKAAGFSRHTFMVGQSGSGKTYTLGVLLERLLVHTSLPIVVVDPNGDHRHLGSLRPREQIAPRGGAPLSQRAHRRLQSALRGAGKVTVASASGGDLPLRIHLSDLSLDEQALVVGLDPLAEPEVYGAFVEVAELLADLPHYGFDAVLGLLQRRGDSDSEQLLRRLSNLRVGDWPVWAATDEPSLVSQVHGHRVVVLDTGSLGDARQRSVVSLAVLGLLRRRPERNAMLLVVDEAHNLFDPKPATAMQRAVLEHGIWVAGEGRKYGVHMLVSTQRPQKIHSNIVSQCDNLVLMRMNSQVDLGELEATFSHVPPAMIREARSFVQGEFLVAGPIATPPLRVATAPRWCPEGGADLPTTWATPLEEQS
jgi:DNA helicase HerA-like ATPase